MTSLSLSERSRIALLSAGRSRRAAVARVLHSPLLRWRYGSAVPGQLLIVPQDLRTADPSFWQEIQLGQFGLAGSIARLGLHSPFEVTPPNSNWARSLHGFAWLRHLQAADEDEARQTARRLTVEWIIRERAGIGLAWEPAIMGRRIISWISHAPLLIEDADEETYEAITKSLAAQVVRLSAAWGDGQDGYPRLLALTALVFAELCIEGHDRQFEDVQRAFSAELSRQILPDGGHISRNPAVLVDLLLELLPLRQCFASRGRAVPETMTRAINDGIAMLRFMRLGDGGLARFNGVSVPMPAALATVLAYDDQFGPQLARAQQSAYARLQCGGSTVIVDAGGPPSFELACEAHAGCLSFEMSSGSSLIFANGGAPGTPERGKLPVARATANHNTLTLGETSSSRIIRDARLDRLIGGDPIIGPAAARFEVRERSGGMEFSGQHDGYVDRFGLVHRRMILLNASGDQLNGVDKIGGPNGAVRLAKDVPFAIHFHLLPGTDCKRDPSTRVMDIRTRDGKRWNFAVQGATPSVEESMFFADAAGSKYRLQIVLRGSTFGDNDVRWSLEARA